MRLQDKTAIITGAGGGFGQAIAKKFTAEGAVVILVDLNLSSVQKLEERLKKEGHKAMAIKADIACEDDVKKMVDQARENFGKIDILINNAGIAHAIPIQQVGVDKWQRGIDVNLKGTYLCMKMVIDDMISQGYGKIVSISSIAGQTGRPMAVDYAASKAGIIGLTRNLAYQVADKGVNVNVVAPGPVVTPMFNFSEEVKEKLRSSIPFNREGSPEDIANAVLFLSSDEAGWITGQVLAVNGGAFMG